MQTISFRGHSGRVCTVDTHMYSSATHATVYLCGIVKTLTLANPHSYLFFFINSSFTFYSYRILLAT
jgi:hypothetical protein